MKTIALFLVVTVLCSAKDYTELSDVIHHWDFEEFAGSKVLLTEKGIVGFTSVRHNSDQPFNPPLPEKKKVTRIEYGLGPNSNVQEFVITDAKEIELVFGIFTQFSTQKNTTKEYFKLIDNKPEQIVADDVVELEMHLCANGYRFFENDNLLLEMDSHIGDEDFFGETTEGQHFYFQNRVMAAFIKYKTRK